MSEDSGMWVKVFPEYAGGGTTAAVVVESATVTPDTASQPGYAIYTFTESGNITLKEPGLVEALLVGGSGGSAVNGAASGAGGFFEDEIYLDKVGVPLTVAVGAGGPPGTAGEASYIDTHTALGGGPGGRANDPRTRYGGSGGGGSFDSSAFGGPSVVTQGNSGGNGNSSARIGGGGGGAGSAGTNAGIESGHNEQAGNGGAGKASDILRDGAPGMIGTMFAGGGGGAGDTGYRMGAGGSPDAGDGLPTGAASQIGTANSGCGTGGCYNGPAQNGTSGIVAIRVAI
jgi:hypothetical protein